MGASRPSRSARPGAPGADVQPERRAVVRRGRCACPSRAGSPRPSAMPSSQVSLPTRGGNEQPSGSRASSRSRRRSAGRGASRSPRARRRRPSGCPAGGRTTRPADIPATGAHADRAGVLQRPAQQHVPQAEQQAEDEDGERQSHQPGAPARRRDVGRGRPGPGRTASSPAPGGGAVRSGRLSLLADPPRSPGPAATNSRPPAAEAISRPRRLWPSAAEARGDDPAEGDAGQHSHHGGHHRRPQPAWRAPSASQ